MNTPAKAKVATMRGHSLTPPATADNPSLVAAALPMPMLDTIPRINTAANASSPVNKLLT